MIKKLYKYYKNIIKMTNVLIHKYKIKYFSFIFLLFFLLNFMILSKFNVDEMTLDYLVYHRILLNPMYYMIGF